MRAALTPRRLRSMLRQQLDELSATHEALDRGVRSTLERRRNELEHAALTTRLLDPRRVLERGYARIRKREDEHQVITDAAEVHAGDAITVEMRDGRFAAHVDRRDEARPGSPTIELKTDENTETS